MHASPLFAGAVARLLCRVDETLGRPAVLDFVDMAAGRGELAAGVLAALPADVAARTRAYAVELAGRPDGLDRRIEWRAELPERTTGLLFANEWLDNVPLEVAEVDPEGVTRLVLVDDDGTERLGPPVTGPEAEWLARWWPLAGERPVADDGEATVGRVTEETTEETTERGATEREAASGATSGAGLRAEIGLPRDLAWASAVGTLARGLAVAVDYAHTAHARPPFGTLTGFRRGRETTPVPDGSCDITAHVALDACAAACALPGARLLPQRAALRALGLTGSRPPLALASTDPAGYVRALAAASEAAELVAPGGLGGFGWLLQPVGIPDVLADAA